MNYKLLIPFALIASVLLSGCLGSKGIEVKQISDTTVEVVYPHPNCGFNDGYIAIEGDGYSDWHRPNDEPEVFTRLVVNNSYKAFLACGFLQEFNEYSGIYKPVYFTMNKTIED